MRKILITSLGAGNKNRNYNKANYNIEGKIYENEEYLASALEEHFQIDKTYYIGTLGSMWENIYDYYCQKYKKIKNDKYEIELFGKMVEFLDSPISKKQEFSLNYINFEEFISTFDKKVIPIITRYGMNDTEIFENFNNIIEIVSELENDDELYLDITHSFRANAFWIFLVMNYINDVSDKNISIKYISYGMYEAKEKNNTEIEITPVINLKIFFDLTKWIKGAYTFKNFGNSDLICDLLENKDIKNKLNNLSNSININYITGIRNSLESLKRNYNLINSVDGPAKLIIPKVVSDFLNHFKDVKEDYEMFFKLAEWHYKEKRYSTAYTNAQEAFRHYAKYNGFDDGNEAKKSLIDLRKQIFWYNKKTDKLNLKKDYCFCFDEKTKSILKDFFENYELCRRIRNDIAHSLESKNTIGDVIKSLPKVLKFLEKIFKDKYFLKKCKEKIDF